MGLFWSYFRDTLRLPFIQARSVLAMLAEGGASALDAARDVILLLRDQFFPSRCEDIYLTRFARSRGIVRAPLEPNEHWLARVRFAYHWWASGGRASAMKEGLLLGFGFSEARVINLRQEDPDRWASFRVELDGVQGEVLNHIDAVRWAIDEVKPARSRLSGLRLAATPNQTVRHSGIIMQRGGVITIYPLAQRTFEPVSMPNQLAIGVAVGHIVTIYPRD